MKRKILLLWKSLFVLSSSECESLGLKFQGNIHGDLINFLGCRSVWVDEFENEYRCSQNVMNGQEWLGVREHSRDKCDYCRISGETIVASIDGGDIGVICKECSERFLYCFSCGSKQSFQYEMSYFKGVLMCNKCSVHLDLNK